MQFFLLTEMDELLIHKYTDPYNNPDKLASLVTSSFLLPSQAINPRWKLNNNFHKIKKLNKICFTVKIPKNITHGLKIEAKNKI